MKYDTFELKKAYLNGYDEAKKNYKENIEWKPQLKFIAGIIIGFLAGWGCAGALASIMGCV